MLLNPILAQVPFEKWGIDFEEPINLLVVMTKSVIFLWQLNMSLNG